MAGSMGSIRGFRPHLSTKNELEGMVDETLCKEIHREADRLGLMVVCICGQKGYHENHVCQFCGNEWE